MTNPRPLRSWCCVALACTLWLDGGTVFAQTPETIASIRIHGNHTTPDADVLALTGLSIGIPVTDARLRDAEERLRTSGRFAGIEIRRRHLSISDPSQVLVVVIVDEHDAVSDTDPTPGAMKRMRSASMWLPIIDRTDGYGFTYGARVAFVNPLGPRTRISVPLTWGGERRAAVDIERTFTAGPLTSLGGSLAAYRRVNPSFAVADNRLEARIRADRRLMPWLRIGVNARTARVDFGGVSDRHDAAGADLTVDTRIDPSFPRNAVHATIGWERVAFDASSAAHTPLSELERPNAVTGHAGRWSADLRGYVGIGGSAVLAMRATVLESTSPLPASEQALLGGSESLRGYRAGYRANDNLAALTTELRFPLNSPLSVGRFGVKTFVDVGTTWADDDALSRQRFERGVGGGLYFGATAVVANIDVAWPRSGSARLHFGLGVTF